MSPVHQHSTAFCLVSRKMSCGAKEPHFLDFSALGILLCVERCPFSELVLLIADGMGKLGLSQATRGIA